MNIVLIDDNADVLGLLAILLRHMGHQVQDFTDPRQALANLSEDTDLVVSDVTMPDIDGFGVAEEVRAILGNHLPKLLLISGNDHQQRLETYPPSIVIGILPKSIRMADLSRVISLLAQTRTRCPGTLGSFCTHTVGTQGEHGRSAKLGNQCFTSEYATCPHYDAQCGISFRLSITAHPHETQERNPRRLSTKPEPPTPPVPAERWHLVFLCQKEIGGRESELHV